MRLIYCNETLRKVEQIPFIANENKAFHEGCRYMQKKVLKILQESKSVDVEPMRHGHWIICSDGYYPYCSKCKQEPSGKNMTNYCSNCGAKMDEIMNDE